MLTSTPLAVRSESMLALMLSGVSSWQTRGLLLCMTVLPFALMLTAYLLYQKKYKLDEDEYRRICRELEEKKKAI